MIREIQHLRFEDDAVIIFSGAGLSAPSGISTYRDAGGVWQKYDQTEVCEYRNWEANTDKVFEFYNEMKKICSR